jgi:hypothetical protein
LTQGGEVNCAHARGSQWCSQAHDR